jgi:F0F1-type ATP synthase assembly protein I
VRYGKGLNGRNKTVTLTSGESFNRRTNQIRIQNTMVVIMIVGGMLIGYGIGQYIVDRWINKSNEEINETPPKTKVKNK